MADSTHEHTFKAIDPLLAVVACECGAQATMTWVSTKWEEEVRLSETLVMYSGQLWAALCKRFFESDVAMDTEGFCRFGERLGLLQAARFDPKVHDAAIDAEAGERISIQSKIGQALLEAARG